MTLSYNRHANDALTLGVGPFFGEHHLVVFVSHSKYCVVFLCAIYAIVGDFVQGTEMDLCMWMIGADNLPDLTVTRVYGGQSCRSTCLPRTRLQRFESRQAFTASYLARICGSPRNLAGWDFHEIRNDAFHEVSLECFNMWVVLVRSTRAEYKLVRFSVGILSLIKCRFGDMRYICYDSV